MILSENPTLYDLLEVAPDASSQELRAAYLRAKAAFKKDSVALYTLIDQDETEELLIQIESAYQTLSSPERRKEYDRSHGLLSVEQQLEPLSKANRKIISIDRVPPMERDSDADLLIPPTTDFNTERAEQPRVSRQVPTAAIDTGLAAALAADLADEISKETDWAGAFLKKIRESKKISLEELSEFTKISRTYLLAIENENYPKLPAAVYLRGFVTQMAKFLKLPSDKVVPAFMARYHQATQVKAK